MGVLKEWKCKAHGPFEEFVDGDEVPECPRGCSARFVVREIRTAPAARGVVMGTLDQMQRELAHDFGLPDIKVGRDDGKSVMQSIQSGRTAPEWVEVPGQMRPGWTQRGEKPSAVPVEAAFGTKQDNALAMAPPPKKIPTNIVGKSNLTLNDVSV